MVFFANKLSVEGKSSLNLFNCRQGFSDWDIKAMQWNLQCVCVPCCKTDNKKLQNGSSGQKS